MEKGSLRALDIVSTMHHLASLQSRNSRFALKQSSLRALRCGGRVPRKISNAHFRDPIFKLRKGLRKKMECGKRERIGCGEPCQTPMILWQVLQGSGGSGRRLPQGFFN